MPKNITDSDAWVTTVTAIQDGDALNEANLSDIGIQHLANRTTHLRKGVPGIAASVTRAVSLTSARAETGWAWDDSDNYVWIQTSVSGAHKLIWGLDHPIDFGKIDEVIMRISGGAGAGHSSLPATMPVVKLWRQTSASDAQGSPTLVGSQTDTTALVGTYDTLHEVTLSGLNHTIQSGDHYFVQLTGEAGANSVANALFIDRVKVKYTA